MGVIEGGVAFFGLMFATVLSGLALWNRIARWLDKREAEHEARREEQYTAHVIAALKERGLVKDGTPEDQWPNGSKTMPDFLASLWKTDEAIQAEMRDFRRQLESEPERD